MEKMWIRKSTIVLIFIVALLVALNIYQYFSSQQNKNSYLKTENSYINVINQTTEALLKDEVNITAQERLQFKEWNVMFEKYGVSYSVGNDKILQIPVDTIEVLELLPENSKPIMMESNGIDTAVSYITGSKTYTLNLDQANDIFVKTIDIPSTFPEYVVGYRNINNEQYIPLFVDTNPHK